MRNHSRDHPELPEVRLIGGHDLRAALAEGWRDFRAAPGLSVALTLPSAALAAVLIAGLYGLGHVWGAGFALIGLPMLGLVAAAPCAEVSRLRARGEGVGLGATLHALRGRNEGRAAALAAGLGLAFLAWLVLAQWLLRQWADAVPGPWFFGLEALLGAGLFVLVFGLSAQALPMLLDRDADLLGAMGTSVTICLTSPGAMAGWGLVVAGLGLGGLMLGFAGLALTLPILGHASWHLYRRAVED